MRSFLYEQKYGVLINEMIEDIRKNRTYFIGPNCIVLIEELCKKMTLKPNMRILDMSCGAGFTSIILAVEVTYANEIPDGKAIWRNTADVELHDADIEQYLTLILMTAIKK